MKPEDTIRLDVLFARRQLLKFGHKIEVGVSRSEVPVTNIDPDDTTGSGWCQGVPAGYGWRVWKPGQRPGEWVGTSSPETAVDTAEKARDKDPKVAGLPIVRIDR